MHTSAAPFLDHFLHWPESGSAITSEQNRTSPIIDMKGNSAPKTALKAPFEDKGLFGLPFGFEF